MKLLLSKSFWIEIGQRYKKEFSDRAFRNTLITSFVFLIIAIIANYFASLYAMERASSPVTDIILSNIPVFEVDWIFIWGPLIFWIIVALFALQKPGKIPFILKSVALFVLIRCIFISLTHIGPFPDHITLEDYKIFWVANFFHVDPRFSFVFSSGADLFFSAHTGIPFLMALAFWKEKFVGVFCLISSIFFGIIVLLGHLHYSIDVASAFFITYTINRIAEYVFEPDKIRFSDQISPPSTVI